MNERMHWGPAGGDGAPSHEFYGSEVRADEEEGAAEARQVVDDYLSQNPGGKERLISLLHRVQEEVGYLPFHIQEYVAASLGLSPIQVYGVVSFYHFFTTTPRGRFQLKVCMGTACFVRRAEALLDTISETLDVEVGGISADRLFNLDQVRCIGACGLAPALMLGDEVHGMLTPARVRNLVRKLRKQAAEDGQPTK